MAPSTVRELVNERIRVLNGIISETHPAYQKFIEADTERSQLNAWLVEDHNQSKSEGK